MFDIPNAKRVRRTDISHSPSFSRSPSPPDPSLVAAYHARLSSLYGAPNPITLSHPSHPSHPFPTNPVLHDATPALEQEEEFSFRLFNTSGEQKIVITEEEGGDGAFVQGRDPRVWRVERATGERRRGFLDMAVCGGDVLLERGRRHFGVEVPWRVVVVKERAGQRGKVGNSGKETDGDDDGREGRNEGVVELEGKRTRPGKKRRIVLRVRKRKGEEERERRRSEAAEREGAEREKRTRRNREKKVKRKMKEKAKKAGVRGDGDGEEVVDEVKSD